MASFEFKFGLDINQSELIKKIEELNNNPEIDGILVQLPLPKHISELAVINAISPEKDVDGFHAINRGRLAVGQDSLVPCTPLGCLMLIKDVLGQDLSGKNAVVIGKSNIVGKPMAQLLINESCTVTICHSKTNNIEALCASADILVVAVGRPKMVKRSWVKDGACVIDVGINRITDEKGASKLVGDVDFDDVFEKAGFITPVPGGVGPMTIACLLNNTLKSFLNK
jgi:methylenetetrahydrofolate dehydrogenase (NADP+)/methenyltetrahydrofolate cyclohydrolase